jgi:hypothetical protein
VPSLKKKKQQQQQQNFKVNPEGNFYSIKPWKILILIHAEFAAFLRARKQLPARKQAYSKLKLFCDSMQAFTQKQQYVWTTRVREK